MRVLYSEGKLRMEAAQFEAHLQKLAKDFGWISEAKHLFGVPGSEFDWSSKDPKAASTQYQQAKNVVKKMNKRVDPNVVLLRPFADFDIVFR